MIDSQIAEANLLLKLRNLKKDKSHLLKKTVLFDLDETLIHNVGPAAGGIAVGFYDESGKHCETNVKIRPYAMRCLRSLSEVFELMVFTAGQRNYADAIIDLLDPDGSIFQHRLYRSDCVRNKEGTFVKDLSVINRKLEDIVLVDNSVWSFSNQLDNGVPVQPWKGQAEDFELSKVEVFLKGLVNVEDVRDCIRGTFNLNEYKKV